jgi:hypothetical protein
MVVGRGSRRQTVESCRGRVAIPIVILACCLVLSFCSGKPAGQGAASPAPAASPAATPAPPAVPAETHAESAAGSTTGGRDSVTGFAPENATGAVKGIPAPTNTAPIVAVANYFTELPGIDQSSLTTRQKEKFLQRVNSELCTCGCRNDTLARCYVNDARCPVVKGMVQKVFEESKAVR